MIGQTLAWWAVSSLLGLMAWPLAWRVFGRLPDRGYGFSRALGILIAGYALWIGASVGVLRNDLGGALGAVVLLGASGAWAAAGRWHECLSWARRHLRTLLTMEVLFLAAFAAWAFVRANNPEITATEKPMELAFLNAILRSDGFPPADPWLSGYAISYYYFGYVLLALLARLTGTASGVAFNLGNALWFGLSVLGAYSLLYNLLALRPGRPRWAAALLGPVFVVISGNLEGLLDMLHARHLFWSATAEGTLTSRFWTWLGIQDLSQPPGGAAAWLPTRYLWWWRASRVVHDVNLAGSTIEVIDEFPFFSFLLADNHPHLLALPFILVAVGFALQVFLAGRRAEIRLGTLRPTGPGLTQAGLAAAIAIVGLGLARGAFVLGAGLPVGAAVAAGIKTGALAAAFAAAAAALSLLLLGAWPSALTAAEFGFAAWLFGSLAFLNTWDWPIYLSLLLAAAWWTARSAGAGEALKRLAATGAGLVVGGALLYLPWYPSFRSQAGGVLPNLFYPTRLPQFLTMFGVALVPVGVWLIVRAAGGWRREERRLLMTIAVGVPLGLLAASWALAGLIALVNPDAVGAALAGFGASDIPAALQAILVRRLSTSWTALALGGMLGACVVLLRRPHADEADGEPWPFVVMLIGLGALLVLGPETLFLKDGFGTRMNTVFKFYFGAWIVWGLAAAYAVASLRWRSERASEVLRGLVTVPLLLGLVYPALATVTKTEAFDPPGGRTLDGTAHLALDDAADAAAIAWMQAHLTPGVVAEAVGGSYSGYARIATHTGFPTVLGWPFHEWQWRGSWAEQGSRQSDIERLYTTRDPGEALDILDRYGIDYVYIGPLERSTYRPLNPGVFEGFMDAVYRSGEVVIFARPGAGDR